MLHFLFFMVLALIGWIHFQWDLMKQIQIQKSSVRNFIHNLLKIHFTLDHFVFLSMLYCYKSVNFSAQNIYLYIKKSFKFCYLQSKKQCLKATGTNFYEYEFKINLQADCRKEQDRLGLFLFKFLKINTIITLTDFFYVLTFNQLQNPY